jgi:hypothetical protein
LPPSPWPYLAHALELPGKRRLSRAEYLAVQPIYYPGFTFGGIAEPAALIVLLALLFLTPAGSAQFWLTLASFAALVLMRGAYWALTHPVNNFWMRDTELKGASAGFFRMGGGSRGAAVSWTDLRDRWEASHVVRAVLGLAALLLLVTAAVL